MERAKSVDWSAGAEARKIASFAAMQELLAVCLSGLKHSVYSMCNVLSCNVDMFSYV